MLPEMLTNQPKLWEALFSDISAFEISTQRRIAAIDIEREFYPAFSHQQLAENADL